MMFSERKKKVKVQAVIIRKSSYTRIPYKICSQENRKVENGRQIRLMKLLR